MEGDLQTGIPHANSDVVTAPARLIFVIAVPEAAAGCDHLQILAPLSRSLTAPGYRERLPAARDERPVLDVLDAVG